MAAPTTSDALTPDERTKLAHYFTQLDSNVFALTNLPEVVKGALFARYSRSPKSLRRLFADEFASDVQETGTNAQASVMSEAFTRARIPHRVRGAGDLLEQPEVRQAYLGEGER